MEPVRAALNGNNSRGAGRVTATRDGCHYCGGDRRSLLGASGLIPFALAILLTFLLTPMINALQRKDAYYACSPSIPGFHHWRLR
jgi:hypothetical protein